MRKNVLPRGKHRGERPSDQGDVLLNAGRRDRQSGHPGLRHALDHPHSPGLIAAAVRGQLTGQVPVAPQAGRTEVSLQQASHDAARLQQLPPRSHGRGGPA